MLIRLDNDDYSDVVGLWMVAPFQVQREVWICGVKCGRRSISDGARFVKVQRYDQLFLCDIFSAVFSLFFFSLIPLLYRGGG